MNAATRIRPQTLRVCRAGSAQSLAARSFTTSTPLRNGAEESKRIAAQAADQLLADHSDRTVVRKQLIDANQLAKLAFTLGRPTVSGVEVTDDTVLPEGTPVPAGYHLVYFTPGGVESQLGPDGTDRTYNAPAPFSNRMWAGGQMKWDLPESDKSGLLVGDIAEEHTRLLSAKPKVSSTTGKPMVLVEVEKQLFSPRGLVLVDRRSWIFRPPTEVSDEKKLPAFQHFNEPSTQEDMTDKAGTVRRFVWSPVALFRFSALTFNGHKIHYNEHWTHTRESHKGLVVHGPLNLINMLNFWQDAHGTALNQSPRSIRYRAVNPIYAGEEYLARTIGKVGGEDGQPIWKLGMVKNGKDCMLADVQ
ncbi:hypothetical protein Sste5346_009073 [Sporothrix stenoceras]|uniref:Mesaconyl-C4 CoA hydratase n=1 Tax=Sporothrix stenoceras TaxID=5173 RepID=A0ABR3YLR7_9PEZI